MHLNMIFIFCYVVCQATKPVRMCNGTVQWAPHPNNLLLKYTKCLRITEHRRAETRYIERERAVTQICTIAWSKVEKLIYLHVS